MPVRRLALTSLLAAVVATATAAASHAQLPANARWATIASANFRITYEHSLEELARHAAASAERAHVALRYMVADAPAGPIDIVLADNVDFSNGYATPFPSNRVVVFVKTPVDALELQYTRDWIELVIVHELAHIFHLDVAGGVGRLVRAIFGRVPWAWPIFPTVGTPVWSIEGLAVGVESNAVGFGRLHGSFHEMVVRTAALESEIDDIHRLSSTSPVWPGGSRVYIYGSLFLDYLTRRFGPDATARIVRATAGGIIPPPLWFSDVGRRALGVPFQQAYADWERELEERYRALAAHLTAAGLTTSERLTRHGRIALYPRFSPNASRIAYTSSDGRTEPRTTVIDAQTGAVAWRRTRNDIAPAAWLPDDLLLTSDLQYVDRFHIYSDLYTLRRGERTRLTHGARLQDADATRDGRRIVAVENDGGTNRLVLVDPTTGAPRAITPFEPDLHWALPRWAPDGSRIAVSRWQTGGRFDIVVVDTLGQVQLEVTDGVGVNTGAAWSPDGRWLLFASDRTGIANLYAAEMTLLGNDGSSGASDSLARARLRQITNVLTGAFYPDVSPDGRWIAFAAYHHDGFAVERMPFDPTSWREPQSAVLAQLPEQRPLYPTQIRPGEFAASVSSAVSRVDTIAGPPAPYRPLRHVRPYGWLPIIETHADDSYFGAYAFGSDLVDRHFWNGSVAAAPASGRTVGALSYVYRGLPSIRALGMHPAVSFAADRYWDEILRIDSLRFRIDEREDRLAVGIGLTQLRWRMSTGISASTEFVRRSRAVFNVPENVRVDPSDDLLGVRATTSLAAYSTPAFAISRQNGAVVQLSARRRWELHPTSTGTRVFDGSYSEWTTWNAAYLALPFRGFARHVLAARLSALHRSGPGASTTGIGGASGEGFGISGLLDEVGGFARLLPVRGFTSSSRRGTRAWTASLEYRVPLALVTRSLAPLPLFLDRVAGSVFADAGHAWCPDPFRCASVSAADPPLISAGAELTGFFSLWGGPLPLRLGLGVPLQGPGRTPRLHLATGAAF